MCDSGIDETKVRCFKMRPDCSGQWLILERWEDLKEEVLMGEDGETWEIQTATLTRHAIDNLPEHDGW